MMPFFVGLKKAVLLVVAVVVWAMPVHASPSKDDLAAIEFLIGYVGKSDVTFVRNFTNHDAERAMRHIQDKYDHFQDEIDSPEEFIELCASKSLLTGREYRVIDTQGRKHLASVWMLGLLDDYRTAQSAGRDL